MIQGSELMQDRALVRRMNSDWRSAQWQLNDLRSVDSVSINQTALSCLLNIFTCLSPLASLPLGEERPLCSRAFVFGFFMSVLSPPSLSRTCSL